MTADHLAGSSVASGGSGAGETADSADPRLIDALASALCGGANRRQPGAALVRIESTGTRLGERRMRLCIVNDDMPFLVDSIAQAIAARGLIIHPLLHPVVCVRR